MPAVRKHEEAFQTEQQSKNCDKGERVHHDATLLEERVKFFAPGEFLRVGNRILDGLVLQNI